jgi:hypothetical protein
MNREVQVRICEGLGVKVPGATRRLPKGDVVGLLLFLNEILGLETE